MTRAKVRAALVSDSPEALDRVYGPKERARLESLLSLIPGRLGRADLLAPGPGLDGLEVLFSTWGMPALEADAWGALPRLKAVFYAAGSVRSFAEPLLRRGVAVFSAAAANAQPTAEFTLAQILLAGKRYLPAQRGLRRQGTAAWAPPACPGNYGGSVALLGAGRVGRRVIELLKAFDLKVLVFDPLLTEAAARGLGVEKVGLEQAFARGQVVSNHLADLPETRGLISGALIRSLPDGATFINSGRGATVDEPALWLALSQRPDLCAVLDVSDPEPPAPDSPAYRLANVFLSPHLAGSLANETGRMAALMLDECEAWLAGGPTPHRVDLDMLATMA